ncbi:hypothetical protein Tco_0801854 [Tanacetum coccineum]|uniref:Uncharacterized protein n=1 Tax=Tanacetum coccineum TaxID=301880 RepID=A0ABQ4ZZF5_9ASTR
MQIIRTCNKHNMIACVEKTAQNADFYQIIDFLTGCSINYSLLVDPDLIGPWLQQFWATASLQVINDVPHIRAKVAGKKILISEATIRADLLFDDENGVDCFPKQVIWDTLRDIGYEVRGSSTPQDFIPSVSLPSKVFTFMRKHSTKFSCRITPLTPSMLEVVTALAAEEEHSTSPHSRAASSARDAQGSPTQSAAHSQRTASVQGTASFHGTATPHDSDAVQGTDTLQGTAAYQGTASIPKSPNDYTPTDASQTSGGDEGLLDIYALNREVRRLKKQTLSQAKQIIKLKAKLKKLSKFVQPVVKHHAFWVESQNLKKQKRRRKKQKKKVSSVKMGRNKEEGTLSEEHYVQEEDTAHPFFDDIVDKDAAVNPDLERKSDETEEVNIEEKESFPNASKEPWPLKPARPPPFPPSLPPPHPLFGGHQSTARQGTITPRTLNFEDEAGPSSPLRPIQIMESEEHLKAAEVLVAISRPRGKGILVEEPKKKKMTLQQIRALETTNDEEVARKIQAEWDAEEERKRFEELKKTKPKTTLRKPTSLAQERNQMMSFLKEKERGCYEERDAKRLSRKRKATIAEEQPSKKPKLRTETIDELRNYLRIVDFEKNAQDRESLEGISMITELQVIDSPDGEYLIIHRENNHFRAFDTLWEILHVLDRQDLYHLYRVVGKTIMIKEDGEIIRRRFHESSGVHTLEIEDGTMIHMLAERRYPLSRELMIRMLDHGMEVEDETETAITLIHLFILWTTEDGMTTAICSQQRQLHPHGLQQFPMNKGNIPLTSDAVRNPSTRVPNPKHNHATQRKLQPVRTSDSKNIRPISETTPEHRVRRRHALHTDPTILHNPNEQGASAPNCVRWAGAPTITNSANAPSRGSRGSQVSREPTTAIEPSRSGPPLRYKHIGSCDYNCQHCGALFWYEQCINHSLRNAVLQVYSSQFVSGVLD